MKPLDVVIIGAGAAGLAAARLLSQTSLRFLVLEARDRVGGRALSLGKLPALECGAEFLHGKSPRTKELLFEHNRSYHDIDPDFHYFDNKTLKRKPAFWKILSRAFSHLKKTRHDRSFEEFLKSTHLSELQQELASVFVEGFDAAHLDQISANALQEASAQVTDPEVRALARTERGYSSFFESMSLSLLGKIFFNCVVDHVEWSKEGVNVHGLQNGKALTFSAKKILLTVPIGVYQASTFEPGSISFNPPLLEFQKNVEKLKMGQVVRLTFRFNGKFQKRLHRRFDYLKLCEVALKEFSLITEIPYHFIKKNLIQYAFHDWTHDPFSRGAYSYPAVGAGNVQKKLQKPIENVLYFAGEAFDLKYTGTVEGAIRSGESTARKIMHHL